MNCQCLLTVCVQFCVTPDCTWDTTGKLFLSFERLSLCCACYISQAHLDYFPPHIHINLLRLIGNSWQSMPIADLLQEASCYIHTKAEGASKCLINICCFEECCMQWAFLVHWTVLFKMRTQITSKRFSLILYWLHLLPILITFLFNSLCLLARLRNVLPQFWNGK